MGERGATKAKNKELKMFKQGHLAGEAISSMFGGRRRQEVQEVLPQNYQLGSEPTGPCAYEIAQFLQCAANHENLQECQAFNEALRDCKHRNRLP